MDASGTGERWVRAMVRVAAHEYIGHGWVLVPTAPPVVSDHAPGSSRDGLGEQPVPVTADRLTTHAAVDRHWDQHPDHQLALITGGACPVVLVIRPALGDRDERAAREVVRRLGRAADVETSSGERHFYFAAGNEQVEHAAAAGRLELRAGGSLVPLPPSMDAWGCRYELTTDRRAFQTLPSWLPALLEDSAKIANESR